MISKSELTDKEIDEDLMFALEKIHDYELTRSSKLYLLGLLNGFIGWQEKYYKECIIKDSSDG